MFLLIQRAITALCLLFLTSCFSGSSCREWDIQTIITQHPCFNGGRLILAPDSSYSHLELEILRNQEGIRFFVNLLFLKAPPCAEDHQRAKVEVFLQDQDEPWIIYPYLFEGGQRLLIPGDIADQLIRYLLDDQTFTIQIGRYRIEVVSTHFATVYQELLDLNIAEIESKTPSD